MKKGISILIFSSIFMVGIVGGILGQNKSENGKNNG